MPRVHHRKSLKDYPIQGINKGDMYYTWRPHGMVWQRSKTKPRRSQLTRSYFLGQIYDIEDEIRALDESTGLQDYINSVVETLEDMKSEAEESKENMPEQLQDGSISEERVIALGDMIDSLENIDTDEKEALEELQMIYYEGS